MKPPLFVSEFLPEELKVVDTPESRLVPQCRGKARAHFVSR